MAVVGVLSNLILDPRVAMFDRQLSHSQLFHVVLVLLPPFLCLNLLHVHLVGLDVALIGRD